MSGGNGTSCTTDPCPQTHCDGGERLMVIEQDLRAHSVEIDHQGARLDESDERYGRMLRAIGDQSRLITGLSERVGSPHDSKPGGLWKAHADMLSTLIDMRRELSRTLEVRPAQHSLIGDDEGPDTSVQHRPQLVKRIRSTEQRNKKLTTAVILASISATVTIAVELIRWLASLH